MTTKQPSRHSPAGMAEARAGFGITRVAVGGRLHPVGERVRSVLPYGLLTEFARPGRAGGRVLVVAPLAGGSPILMRDLVVGLLRHRPRVAVTEWLDIRHLPAGPERFTLADNIAHVVAMARSLGPRAHLVGVCQGVVPTLAAAALIAERDPSRAPASVSLVAGPVDPLANPTHAVAFARDRPLDWFEDDVIATVPPGFPGAGRRCYPAASQARALSAYIARHGMGGEVARKLLFDDGEDPIRFPFARLMFSLRDLPAEFFLDMIRLVFQEGSLAAGAIRAGSERLDFDALDNTALLTVEGSDDDIAAPGQTRAAHGLCRRIPDGLRRHVLVRGGGHFSLFHGATLRSSILPEILRTMNLSEASGRGRRRA